MRIKLFFTSHRQVDEYLYSSEFFNRSDFFKQNSDILICHNNHSLSEDLILSKAKYNTNIDIVKVNNTGYYNGLHTSINDCFHLFKGYDFVIHLHPDVYLTRDKEIIDLLESELNTDNQMIVDYHQNHNNNYLRTYCTDFFIFKPSVYNFFGEVNMINPIAAEAYLYEKIEQYNIKHRTICRENSLYWEIDSYGIIHNHNLDRIKSILDGNENKNFTHH